MISFKNLTPILTILTFSIFLSSCGGDDDKNESVSIVGKWQIQSRELFNCSSASLNGVLQCTANSTSTDCGTWEFKSDGNYAVVYDGGGYTQQYKINSNSTMELCHLGDCYPYSYSLSGNKLTITEVDIGNGTCLHKWVFVKI